MNAFLGYLVMPAGDTCAIVRLSKEESGEIIQESLDTTDVYTLKLAIERANFNKIIGLEETIASIAEVREQGIYHSFLNGNYVIDLPMEIAEDVDSICFDITQTVEEKEPARIYDIFSLLEKSHFLEFVLSISYEDTYAWDTPINMVMNIPPVGAIEFPNITAIYKFSKLPEWVIQSLTGGKSETYSTKLSTIMIPTIVMGEEVVIQLSSTSQKTKYINSPLIQYDIVITCEKSLNGSLHYTLLMSDLIYDKIIAPVLKDAIETFFIPCPGIEYTESLLNVAFDVKVSVNSIAIKVLIAPKMMQLQNICTFTKYQYINTDLHRIYSKEVLQSSLISSALGTMLSGKYSQSVVHDVQLIGREMIDGELSYIYQSKSTIVSINTGEHQCNSQFIYMENISDRVSNIWCFSDPQYISEVGFTKNKTPLRILGYATLINSPGEIHRDKIWDDIYKAINQKPPAKKNRLLVTCYHDTEITRVQLAIFMKDEH